MATGIPRILGPVPRTTTRKERIQEAVTNELTRMGAGINALPSVRAVSIVVKMKADGSVRTVITSLETESGETS